MKYKFIGISTDVLSFSLSGAKIAPNKPFEVVPHFDRRILPVENSKLVAVSIAVKIESTEEKPLPYNISAVLTGLFEPEKEKYTADEERSFVIEATKIVYPYLNTAVTGLMAQAHVRPIVLPIVEGTVFKEDRPEEKPVYGFTVDNNIN